MKKILTTQVTNSIFEVMETMFYFAVEEKSANTTDLMSLFDLDSLKACTIDFSGSSSGTICLLIPTGVLAAMTASFMGSDQESDTEEMQNGTLKEALNMIAGNALTKVDKESYMGLGIPELADPSKITCDDEFAIFKTQDGGMMAAFVNLNT